MNLLLKLSQEKHIWTLSIALLLQLAVMLVVKLTKKKKPEEEEF